MKLYAGALSFLHGNPGLRGKVELALNSRKPSQPQRIQNWIGSFLDGMKKGSPKIGETQFQLHIPSDNPLLGFVELMHLIAESYPVLLEIQNIHHTHSVAIATMVKALLHKTSRSENSKLLTILSCVSLEENSGWVSQPLQDVFTEASDTFQTVHLESWGVAEVEKYLTSKDGFFWVRVSF